MSIAAWCKENNVSKGKFHYWNHKLMNQQKVQEELHCVDISNIVLNSSSNIDNDAKSHNLQVILKDMKIIIPENFNQDTLRNLIGVLVKL